MDDRLATVLIVSGGVVTVLWLALFMVARWRAHRRQVADLGSADPVERARAAARLVGSGRRGFVRAVYRWVPTEPDARTRVAVAWSVLQAEPRRRAGWSGKALRAWAELEAAERGTPPAMDSPGGSPTGPPVSRELPREPPAQPESPSPPIRWEAD